MAEDSSSTSTNIPGPPYSGPASKPILDKVKFPADMKSLNMRELKQVSDNMQLFLVETSTEQTFPDPCVLSCLD